MESLEERRAPRAPRGVLARVLALAYFLVIAYASLQPFSGWWIPPPEIRLFLTAPWPRYITLEDVLVNIGAYVPLGFLLARAYMRPLGTRRAVLVAAALAVLTSVAMETVQMFMPSRIASNVDVLTNGLGGLIGALAAPLFAPTRGLGMRLARARQQWFVYGPTADVGLVLLCLWILTQLHPAAQLFGTGNLRETFDLPVWFFHQPQLILAAEAAVVGCNLLGVGLIIVALTRESKPRGAATAAALATGIGAKALTAAAFTKASALWAWITPGVVLGILVGGVVLYGLMHRSRRAQWIAACASLVLAIAIINVGPENPYQTVPPQFLAGGPTHFLSFSGIVRALSELWPFLALTYAAVVASMRPVA